MGTVGPPTLAREGVTLNGALHSSGLISGRTEARTNTTQSITKVSTTRPPGRNCSDIARKPRPLMKAHRSASDPGLMAPQGQRHQQLSNVFSFPVSKVLCSPGTATGSCFTRGSGRQLSALSLFLKALFSGPHMNQGTEDNHRIL